MRAFELILQTQWAIRSEDDLRKMIEIANRTAAPDFEAVALRQADRADQTGMLQMFGNIAVLNINGPIFRYANLFTQISGATSIDMLGTRLGAALDDPAVAGILLNINSPGGEVAGTHDFAEAVFAGRSKKPIMAFGDSLVASGAYWIGSAAESLVLSATAQVGSIGVISTVTEREQPKGVTTYNFISSVSPYKRIDPKTDEGGARMQTMVDDLANVFVAAVAKHRGVSTEKVLADFGQGGVVIASKAIAAGMADEVGTFESALEALRAKTSPAPIHSFGGPAAKFPTGGPMANNPAAESSAANPAQPPAPAQASAPAPTVNEGAIRSQAVTEERARIRAILTSPEAEGREQLARTIALETDTPASAAATLLAAANKATSSGANPFAARMSSIPNPTVGGDPADQADDVAAAVRETVALFQGKEKQ